MADPSFLRDLALVFLVAGVTTVVFYRLKQPIVLGYIVAGLIVSPFTPPQGLSASPQSIQTISEIGLVFLLFSLGLRWSLATVRRLGAGLLVATPVEAGITMAGGTVLGLVLGWAPMEAFLLGLAISVSSTVIILKILTELGELDAPHGRAALGISALEDLIGVAGISLVSGFLATGVVDVGRIGSVIGVLLLFIAVTVVIGYVAVPRLVSHVARFHVSDVLVVTLVGIAFAMALLAQSLGFAAAFGAFLAGFLITGSERLADVHARVEPLRDVFGAIFFVSIGMQVDPQAILAHWGAILAVAGGLLVLKPVAATAALVLAGRGGHHAARTGLCLLPIGEMGFIIAGVAAGAGVAPQLLTVLIGVALLTTLVAPYATRRSDTLARAMGRLAPNPLRRFTRDYAAWTDRLVRRSMPDPGYRKAVRRRVGRAFVDLVIILTCFVLAGAANSLVPSLVPVGPARLPTELVLLGIAIVLSAPPFILMLRNVREVQMLLVRGMTPDRLWGADAPRSVVARVVRDTVAAAALILVAVLVLLTLLPFAPSPPVLLVFGLLILGATLLFFDAAVALHRRLQSAIETAFAAGLSPESRREVEDLLADQYPWGVVFEEATVASGSAILGRPLGELDMRRHTGATIVSISRGERVVVNPGAGEMLVPGDRVLVAGEPSQVVRARDLIAGAPPLEAHLGGVGATTLECLVPAGSPVAGKTLRESALRNRTGTAVLALVRGGRVASHPGPEETLRPGDRLLLVGTSESVERARRFITGGPGDGAG